MPDLGHGALGGLTVPDESIICTWTTTLALATDAVNRGAALLPGHRVESIAVGTEPTTLHTTVVRSRRGGWSTPPVWAPTFSTRIFGYDRFTVTPRRGELIVFDKLARPWCPRSCCRCRQRSARACWSAPRSTAT